MADRDRRIGALLFSLLATGSAFASLGDHVTTINNDQKVYRTSAHTVRALANYTVHEIANGATTIHEYVDASGTVFAVTWRGGAQPNLETLLGSYLVEFQAMNRSQARILGRHSSSKLSGPHLVIERYGHMRAVQGKAYIPSALPQGVTADVLE
jgi:hypothetical protein